MKKIFFFTAISFLTLSSCKKETATLSQDQTVAESQLQTNASSSGGAFTFNDVTKQNLDGEQFYNPCANEQMTATTWNRLIDFHGIYNGNKSTITFHVNVQGFKAVGESGREYILAATYNEQQSAFSNGVFTAKLVRHVRATTPGGGSILYSRIPIILRLMRMETLQF
jgi:hypothetical protein